MATRARSTRATTAKSAASVDGRRARGTEPREPKDALAPVDARLAARIRAAAERARGQTLRRLTARSSAETVAAAIEGTLAFARDRTAPALRLGDLAALYGDALARRTRWRWHVWREGGRAVLAVVSPRREYAVLPGALVAAQAAPDADLTLLSLLRRIALKKLPKPGTGAPIVLG